MNKKQKILIEEEVEAIGHGIKYMRGKLRNEANQIKIHEKNIKEYEKEILKLLSEQKKLSEGMR